jgi:hypothetical protein
LLVPVLLGLLKTLHLLRIEAAVAVVGLATMAAHLFMLIILLDHVSQPLLGVRGLGLERFSILVTQQV